MLKKTYIFILFSQLIFSQNVISDGKVEYDMFISYDGVVHFDATLLFNSTISLFEYKVSNSDNFYTEKILDNGNYEINKSDFTSTYVFIDKKSKLTYEIKKSLLTKEKISVKEDSPVFNWELLDEKKQIGSYVCHKALTFFRGREYTAWYSLDLPYNIGPWKFNNLPGMILEVVDSKQEVVFMLKSIKIPFNKEIVNFTTSTKIITREEDLKQNERFLKDSESKIQSKLSRNVKVTVANQKINSIEK